jgi:hypothetical protein
MGRPAKTLEEHRRDHTFRADRHAHLLRVVEPTPVEKDPRGGSNRKSLLQLVEDRSFRVGRHDHLLFDDDSLLNGEADDVRVVGLRTLQLFYRATTNVDDREAAASAFAALAGKGLAWPWFRLLGELGWYREDDTGELVLGFEDEGTAARALPGHRARAGLRVRID